MAPVNKWEVGSLPQAKLTTRWYGTSQLFPDSPTSSYHNSPSTWMPETQESIKNLEHRAGQQQQKGADSRSVHPAVPGVESGVTSHKVDGSTTRRWVVSSTVAMLSFPLNNIGKCKLCDSLLQPEHHSRQDLLGLSGYWHDTMTSLPGKINLSTMWRT